MKSFLLKDKKPICKWGMIPQEIYFEGGIPEGYGLAVCPNEPYIILDIDKHNINGYKHLPIGLISELRNHFNYKTKSGGRHIWIKYSGNKTLLNKTSKLGIDLRTHKGYVKWYLEKDIREYIPLIKESSIDLNNWLENLFAEQIIENDRKRNTQ